MFPGEMVNIAMLNRVNGMGNYQFQCLSTVSMFPSYGHEIPTQIPYSNSERLLALLIPHAADEDQTWSHGRLEYSEQYPDSYEGREAFACGVHRNANLNLQSIPITASNIGSWRGLALTPQQMT